MKENRVHGETESRDPRASKLKLGKVEERKRDTVGKAQKSEGGSPSEEARSGGKNGANGAGNGRKDR